MDLVLKKKARENLSEAGKKGADITNYGVSPYGETSTLDPVHVDERLAKMVEVKRHYQQQIEANNPVGRPAKNVENFHNYKGKTRDVIGGIGSVRMVPLLDSGTDSRQTKHRS